MTRWNADRSSWLPSRKCTGHRRAPTSSCSSRYDGIHSSLASVRPRSSRSGLVRSPPTIANAGAGSSSLIVSITRRSEALVSIWPSSHLPPAMMWVSVKCTKEKSAGTRASMALVDPANREHPTHPLGGEFRVAHEPGPVHQHQLLGEVNERARALQAGHHAEVRLVAVQVGREHDARLVEPRRRA